jgi:hypothetical protein
MSRFGGGGNGGGGFLNLNYRDQNKKRKNPMHSELDEAKRVCAQSHVSLNQDQIELLVRAVISAGIFSKEEAANMVPHNLCQALFHHNVRKKIRSDIAGPRRSNERSFIDENRIYNQERGNVEIYTSEDEEKEEEEEEESEGEKIDSGSDTDESQRYEKQPRVKYDVTGGGGAGGGSYGYVYVGGKSKDDDRFEGWYSPGKGKSDQEYEIDEVYAKKRSDDVNRTVTGYPYTAYARKKGSRGRKEKENAHERQNRKTESREKENDDDGYEKDREEEEEEEEKEEGGQEPEWNMWERRNLEKARDRFDMSLVSDFLISVFYGDGRGYQNQGRRTYNPIVLQVYGPQQPGEHIYEIDIEGIDDEVLDDLLGLKYGGYTADIKGEGKSPSDKGRHEIDREWSPRYTHGVLRFEDKSVSKLELMDQMKELVELLRRGFLIVGFQESDRNNQQFLYPDDAWIQSQVREILKRSEPDYREWNPLQDPVECDKDTAILEYAIDEITKLLNARYTNVDSAFYAEGYEPFDRERMQSLLIKAKTHLNLLRRMCQTPCFYKEVYLPYQLKQAQRVLPRNLRLN